MIKLLIADDHAVVREGLKQIVSETNDMVIVGEVSNGQEVLEEVWRSECDVVLLDISMPGRSGVDILKQLRSESTKHPILILTMYPEEQYAVRVLKAGASGYLTKRCEPEELLAAIRKVSRGGKYISSSLAETLAFEIVVDNTKPPHEKLSDREYQVMCMIALGRKVKEIAVELSLSVKTISTHRTRILQKMNMKNNAEIIRYAIKNKLVE
ncbi:MAG: response regulator transcription factor [Thermodesulfobacteriota bacterium]